MALKRTRETEHRIIACVASGLNQRQTAAKLGLHYNTICRILKDPRVKKIMASSQPEATSSIANHAAEVIQDQTIQAVATMHNIIQDKTDEVVESLQEKFDRAAEPAFARLLELMEAAESEGIQLKAIENILDRSTQSPKRQIHSKINLKQNVVVLHATAAWLEEAQAAMLEVGVDASTLLPINPDGETITLDRTTGKMVNDDLLSDTD